MQDLTDIQKQLEIDVAQIALDLPRIKAKELHDKQGIERIHRRMGHRTRNSDASRNT